MIVVLCGSSGSGKDTIGRTLGLPKPISVTTRPMRAGEVNGIDYLFVTDEEFTQLEAEGGLAEKTEYVGNGRKYGILKETLLEFMEEGQDVYLACDAHGLEQIQTIFPDTVATFYVHADRDVCRSRMIARGDDEELIESRYESWPKEHEANMKHCEYIITNDGSISLEDIADAIRFVVDSKRPA